jgi:hypothetical protein
MFPARFHRLSRALDLALEFATLGELRLAEPLDTWEEHAAGWPETTAAAELAPSLPPPFQPGDAASPPGHAPFPSRDAPFPPATAAGRRAAEERRAFEERRAAERARGVPTCAGAREQRHIRRPRPRPGRERAGAVKLPEQPCLWTGP